MRQGPDYRMWGPVTPVEADGLWIRLPLELVDEWSEYKAVNWHVNKDGTVLLTPSKDI